MRRVAIGAGVVFVMVLLVMWVRAKEPELRDQERRETVESIMRDQERLCARAERVGVELGGCPRVRPGQKVFGR